jgi:hypothetical protein
MQKNQMKSVAAKSPVTTTPSSTPSKKLEAVANKAAVKSSKTEQKFDKNQQPIFTH